MNDSPTQSQLMMDSRTVLKYLQLWGDQSESEIIRQCNLITQARWFRVRRVLLQSKKIASVDGKPTVYTLLVTHD